MTRIDMKRNELVVAFDRPDSPDLYASEVEVQGLSFTNQAITLQSELLAKPRYRDPSQAITYTPLGNNRAKVTFAEPQRALSSGQVLALYDNDKLLGGGFYR